MENLREKIQTILEDDKIQKFHRIKKILSNDDIKFLEDNYKDSVRLEESVYLFYHNKLHEDFKCACGKQVGFHTLKRGFNKVCSMSCHGKTTARFVIASAKARALPILTKTCITCGNEFTTKLSERIACSKSCGCIYNHLVRTDEQKQEIDIKRKKTCLEKYGNEYVINSKFSRAKTKAILGVEYPWQSKVVLAGIRERNYEKYGVYNPMQTQTVIDKMIATKVERYGGLDTYNHYKDYTFPSGRVDKVQGYEPQALDTLMKTYSEDDIIIGHTIGSITGTIKYFSPTTQRYHHYYPDIFIISENKVIEVKSNWTYEKQKDTNLLKQQAVLDAGYAFEFMIL